MHEHIDRALDSARLDRYLAGAVSTEEHAQITAWLAQNPEWAKSVRVIRTMPLVEGLPPFVGDVAGDLDRVRTAINAEAAEALRRGARGRSKGYGLGRQSLPRMLAAFTVVLIVLASAGVEFGRRHGWPERSNPTFSRYTTRAGQRLVVTLADGSRVILAPQTELIVSPHFGRTNRVVSILGEGHFTVTPTKDSPFIVRTGRASTRVLGTAFDVLYDSETQNVRVAVIAGRVAFGMHSGTVLSAGTVAEIRDSTVVVHPDADMTPYNEWPAGRLRFRNAAVGDVLSAVGRWYGVKFRLQDSAMAHDRVTITFDYPSRADALTAIKVLLNVSMAFNGDVVTLHPDRSQHMAPSRRQGTRDGLVHPTEVGR
jgi:ferric-dicitrate binding protein FerR (iron transport regulator)